MRADRGDGDDFGLAMQFQTTVGIRGKSGAIVGTPCYMAPEQVAGTTVDARTDVYSTGLVLYTILCGKGDVQSPAPLNELHRAEKSPARSAWVGTRDE